MTTTAQYIADTITGENLSLRVTDDSVTPPLVRDVPLDNGNRDYQAVMAAVDAGQITITPAPPPDWSPNLKRLRDERIETAFSVTVDGHEIQIRANSRTRLALAAKVSALLIYNDGRVTNWKAENDFFDLTAAQLMELMAAIDAHEQNCFDAEKAVLDQANQVGFESWDEMKTFFIDELEAP